MKVILLNTSPNEKGCTYTALCEMQKIFTQQEIETQIITIDPQQRGCIGCGACKKTGKCAFGDGKNNTNEVGELIMQADGLVIGSPVHYAAASGAATAFLDRMFYTFNKRFSYKVGCAVVSCRRGGASATFDQLNKYFTINNMPLAPSQYWNQVHGSTPQDVLKDEEGMQTMRTLARNMSFMIKAFDIAKKNGLELPQHEAPVRTNFIN